MAKSPYRRFTVSLDVTLVDGTAAIKAARDDIVAKQQGKRGDIKTARDAIHWLLDPGSPFDAGIEIDESRIEEHTGEY